MVALSVVTISLATAYSVTVSRTKTLRAKFVEATLKQNDATYVMKGLGEDGKTQDTERPGI